MLSRKGMIKSTKVLSCNMPVGGAAQPQRGAKCKAPNEVKRISKEGETGQLRQNSRVQAQKDCTVESSQGYGRHPQGLKCSPRCKNVWATIGIHSFLQKKRVNMVPGLIFVLHFHKLGLMGKRLKEPCSPHPNPADSQ